MDEIEELRIQLKLEKLKSSIYRDIIETNTNIRISLTQPENIITLFMENVKNKEFYNKVSKFYGELKGQDKESKTYSFLNRYYIFQKME